MQHALPEYYNWEFHRVPSNVKTKKQWLKLHRRVRKNVEPVGTLTCIFDKPRARPKGVDPVSPEECDRIRTKLSLFGPDPCDLPDLDRLDRTGQLVIPNLYDGRDTEEITSFTEAEAERLLGYMIWDHSHEGHYITEKTEGGERKRATWKTEFSIPNFRDHLIGEQFYGPKKGRKTMQVAVDLDRHRGTVNGQEHIIKVLAVGEILKSSCPDFRFAPEINPRNGSVKFFGWLSDYIDMTTAEKIAERLRHVLQDKLPQYDFNSLEIFPSNSPQVFAPLRADKIMVIGGGVVKKIKRRKGKGKNRKVYDAYSCAHYLNWVFFSDQPYDSAAFEAHLREAVARMPDTPVEEQAERKTCKPRPKKESSGKSMGSIGRLKGRCASALVKFWSELEVPEDDTLGKYLIVTLRVLRYEGLDRDEAVDWVEERLLNLKNTAFSDRLTDNFAEIQRVLAKTATAVWDGNGYQRDPELSEAKLRASVAAWACKGFYLHKPSTWHNAPMTTLPQDRLVWTAALLALLPELAAIAHTSQDKAKTFLETVLAFVQHNNELSKSMVGRLLEQCGISGSSGQKQYDVRKFLEQKGLLLKQKNYFSDNVTGYRHGNFYICGPAVQFEQEAVRGGTHTVSIYLSLNLVVDADETALEQEVVMERRRLACEWRYQERIRRLRQQFRMAA